MTGAKTTRSSGQGSLVPLFLGTVTALAAGALTFAGMVYFQQFARTLDGWVQFGAALVGFWVIVLFGVAFVGAVTDNPMSRYYPQYSESAVWAGYGVLLSCLALGGSMAAAWRELALQGLAPARAFTQTPVASAAILIVVGSVGYVYTQLDQTDDEGSAAADQQPTDEGATSQSDNQNTNGGAGNTQTAANRSGTSGDGREIMTTELTYDWQRETDVTMDDVGGLADLKRQLRTEVIRPLTTGQDKAAALDISTPNILLYGPPGTGKTFLAHALATELCVPFVSLSGADVTSKWINESPQRIQRLFTEAQALADREGAAVVFLDEIDAVLSDRSGPSHEESKKIVNEFLTQLADIDDKNVVFIGATNRRDALDEAAVRRGRIDREFEFTRPDYEARVGILHAQLQSRENDVSDAQICEIADATAGCSAADLAALIDDAARHAAFKRDAKSVSMRDISAVQ